MHSFKVYAQFSVNHKGEIIKISARGPHKIFEEEAETDQRCYLNLDPPELLREGKSMEFTCPTTDGLSKPMPKRKKEKEKRRNEKRKNITS